MLFSLVGSEAPVFRAYAFWTGFSQRCAAGCRRAPGALVVFSVPREERGSRAPTGAGADTAAPSGSPRGWSRSPELRPEIAGGIRPAGAPCGALLRRSPFGGGPRFQQRALSAAVSQLLAGDHCVPGRSPAA